MEASVLFLLVLLIPGACSTPNNHPKPIKYSDKTVSKPELFAEGLISTEEASEFDICLSPDGKTAYFTRRKGNEKQKIWRASYQNGEWSSPTQLPFSTDRDETPFVSPDGRTLFFGSARPIPGRLSQGNFDMNIWQVNWADNQWGTPQPLSESINAVQQEGEEWPSSNENFIFSLDNTTFIYATMLRGHNAIDVYMTVKEGNSFSNPERISGLFQKDNTWKYSAVFSPDGQFLLFNSYEAEGGVGGEDIFISQKTTDGWTQAVSIGNAVNTPAEESSPRFSPDGRYFFFARETRQKPDEDGVWSIYYVETKYLQLEKLF